MIDSNVVIIQQLLELSDRKRTAHLVQTEVTNSEFKYLGKIYKTRKTGI